MSQEPITVTYSLETILARIEGKIDRLDEKIDDVKIEQVKLSEKVEAIDNRLKMVEGTQKNQIWALIVLLTGAIATPLLRLFFSGNP